MTPKNWYDDLDDDSVAKASEILPNIELPDVDKPPIIITPLEEPRTVETKQDRDMFVGRVAQLATDNRKEGTMIYPKSLRFNIAKAFAREGKNFKKMKITGKVFKIWAIEDPENHQKYYQAELLTQTTLKNE